MSLNNPVDQHALAKLSEVCPGTTSEERLRFYVGKGKNYDLALKQLSAYMDWRRECGLDDKDEVDVADGDNTDNVVSEEIIDENSDDTPSPVSAPSSIEESADVDNDETKNDSSSDQVKDDEGTTQCTNSLKDTATTSTSTSTDEINNDNVQEQLQNLSTEDTVKSEPELTDVDDWNKAAEAAIKYCKEDPTKNPSNILPRLARFDCVDGTKEMYANDGKKILQFIPAQMDLELASEVCYATALAFYLDRKLKRNSVDKVIVSVDVRAGKGWKNPPAGSIVPFIKKTISILEQNFPERLAKSIVYPMPFAASALWRIIKVFLDANTANKISILSGPALEDSPLPKAKLEKYISGVELDRMELNRESSLL